MTQRNPLLFLWLKICWCRVFSMTLVCHKLFAFAASSLFLDKDLIICVKLLLWTVRLGYASSSEELFGLCNITLSLVDQKLVQTTMKGLQ